MVNEKIICDKAPNPVGPYPHARRVGNLIFVSGMGPRKKGSDKIPGVNLDAEGRVQSHNIEEQAKATLENIKMVLEEAGSSLEDVVDVQCFLTDMKCDFRSFNKVYDEYLGEIGPARTTVEVRRLPTKIAVELKVVAYVKGDV